MRKAGRANRPTPIAMLEPLILAIKGDGASDHRPTNRCRSCPPTHREAHQFQPSALIFTSHPGSDCQQTFYPPCPLPFAPAPPDMSCDCGLPAWLDLGELHVCDPKRLVRPSSIASWLA